MELENTQGLPTKITGLEPKTSIPAERIESADCPRHGLTPQRFLTCGVLGEIKQCVLCEADLGEKHVYIYLGESYEAVYHLRPDTCAQCLTTPIDGECECGR